MKLLNHPYLDDKEIMPQATAWVTLGTVTCFTNDASWRGLKSFRIICLWEMKPLSEVRSAKLDVCWSHDHLVAQL